MNELDKLAIELSKSFRSVSLPPKLRYKVKKWLKTISAQTPDKQMDRRRIMQTAKKELTAALLDKMVKTELAKNEVMARQYDNGSIRFDFGSDIPDHVKRAAMTWAKKRGLSPVEASLHKNCKSSSEYVICGDVPDASETGKELIRLKF